mgnify:FL=1
MENKNNLDSLYTNLFVLGIVEAVLLIFLGFFVGIATFIVALIIKSRLPKNSPTPTGIKIMIIASATHFIAFFLNIFMSFISIIFSSIYLVGIFSVLTSVFYFLALMFVFVMLIIGCIMVYKESQEYK